MGYIINVPEIQAVSITPNPTIINEEILIEVVVSEKKVELQPVSLPAGTFYAGEEDK